MDETSVSGREVAVADEPRMRAGGALKWMLALFLLAGVAFMFWWTSRGAKTAGEAAADPAQQLSSQVDSLMHSVAQIRGATDTLRARLDDGDKVDASVRQQMLSLSERTRLLEDAVANLANKRLSGHDVLALDEAELLLTLGGERFSLFRDTAGAVAAYRAADTALSEVEDAAFSTVRQSINAEIAALNATSTADTSLVAAQIDQLRARIEKLPAVRRLADANTAPESDSRLMRVLGGFVQIHHDDDAHKLAALTDASLARSLAILDLRDAQAASLTRDTDRYKQGLSAAKDQIAAAFDAQSPDVVAALAQIDTLEKAPLAPSPPSLIGASLKELRNLRASHALRASSGTAIPPEALNAEGDKK
ncbi:MAG TPA: uroporphyrinogen-III C-methyltransferase [Rudaea sp.]|jgi:uroporphyrin-3 C-methyltransferase|nr:uroporphyrinogen-III C-methyltransferase [Rudaea sp.]